MKEKALEEYLYNQSVKILNAVDGDISPDEAVADFIRRPEAGEFKDRLNKMITKETKNVETKEVEKVETKKAKHK